MAGGKLVDSKQSATAATNKRLKNVDLMNLSRADSLLGLTTRTYKRPPLLRRSSSLNTLPSPMGSDDEHGVGDDEGLSDDQSGFPRPTRLDYTYSDLYADFGSLPERSYAREMVSLGLLTFVERFLTVICVTVPESIMHHFQWVNKVVSWICVIFVLQVIGVLWAFNINVISNLALMAGGSVARADLGNIGIFKAIASVYVIYATMRVLVIFGQFTWYSGLAALKHFPRQRQMILLDRGSKGVMISALCIIITELVALLTIPKVCSEPYSDNMLNRFCHWSVVPRLTDYESPAVGTITACSAVAISQILQFVCYEIPNWRLALRGRFLGKVILHVLLFVAMGCCAMVVVHFVEDVGDFSLSMQSELLDYLGRFTFADVRLVALISIGLFLLVLMIFARLPQKPINDIQAQLAINLMKRIKWTLVVLMNFYILLVSLHPRGGMVYAMEHLFVISITTPVMYITVYSLSTMFMKTSYKQMIVFTPIVTIATTVACTASSINGGMSYFLVFVHLFGLVVDMYGYTEVFRPFLNDMGLDVDSLLKPMPNSDMKSEGYHRRKTMAVHYSRRGSTVTDDNDRNGITTAQLNLRATPSPEPRRLSHTHPIALSNTRQGTSQPDTGTDRSPQDDRLAPDNEKRNKRLEMPTVTKAQVSSELFRRSSTHTLQTPRSSKGQPGSPAMGGVGSPSPLRNKDRKPISPSKSQIVPKIGGSAGSETTMAKSRSVGGRDEGEKYNLDKYIHKDKQKQMDRKRASMLAFQFSRVDGYHSSTHDYSTDQLLSVQDRKRALEAKKEKGRQKQQMTINEQSTDSTEPHQGRGASERDTSTQLTRKVTNNTAKREVRDAIEADTLRRMKEYESNTQWRSERRREMRSTSMLTQAVRFTAQMLLGVGFVFGLVMMTLSMLAYIQEDYASHLKAPIYFSSTSSALKLDNAHVIEWDLHKNMTTWGADNGTDSGTGGVLGRLHDSLYSPSPDPPNTTTTHTLNPRSDPGVNLDTCPKDSNRGCVNPKWGKGQSPKWTPSAVPLYSVCGRHWHGLTVIDYGLLSQASYFLPEKQNEVVSAFFVDRPGIPQARIIHAEDTLEPICACDRQNMDDCECETAAQAKIWRAKFMEVYFDSLDLTVIAVQGTDPANIGDVVEDVRMWTETVVYQILSWAYPIVRMWPDHLVAFLVENLFNWLSLVGLNNNHWYYHKIIAHVRGIMHAHPSRSIVITGHSLGGGLARITGYLTGKSSVTFSAPGIAHTYRKVRLQDAKMNKKFDDPSNHWDFISKDHLHHKTLNIMPDHDLIAMIDSQAGLVQQMRCMHESPACHSLELTMCELLTQCGDPRHRFSGCSVKLEPARLVQALLDFIRPVLLPMTCLLVMQMALVWLLRFTYIRMKEQGADGLDFGYGQSR